MKHLGDITKIHGCAVPIADCVIGGSPCQDLSVAGKREGLAGARSGLFMEQIRIVKEMRYADQCSGRTGQFILPRYMVWENVPGAFSSNKGEDFRAVLEETARVADANAAIPRPPKKWANAGCIMGDGWSIAWHVLDAQFWGVPQRRRRIALVADFGGYTAPEILFERNGLCWDSAQGGEAGQGTAGDFEGSVGETVCLLNDQGGSVIDAQDNAMVAPTIRAQMHGNIPSVCAGFKLGSSEQARSIGFQEERSPTLNAECGGNKPAICYGFDGYNQCLTGPVSQSIRANKSDGDHVGMICYGICSDASNSMKSDNPHSGIYKAETSRTLDLNGGNPACNQGGICVAQCYDMTHATDVIRECGETAPTLQSRMGTGGNQIPLTFSMQGFGDYKPDEVASSCKMRDYKDSTDLIAAVDCRNATETETNGTLQAKPSGGQSLNLNNVVRTGYAVRRLTPLECERLQGFPDGWTDIGAWTDSNGKLHKESSDSARYKALGNSIALPPWKWVLKRLCAFYERDATMASLFDGIGGFPLIWEQLNGKGSCLWASEIEEFPIAVTKRRFSELEATP